MSAKQLLRRLDRIASGCVKSEECPGLITHLVLSEDDLPDAPTCRRRQCGEVHSGVIVEEIVVRSREEMSD
jgi:hypothetical protein